MSRTRLKQLMQSPQLKVGHFIVEFVTPGIGHILKQAGCDFVFLDMEHSGFTFETIKSALRYFEAADLPVIVRVPALENDMLARACDMGAEGLIAPMISTAAQAQAMVDSVKYFPAGKRGVGLQMAHDNYRIAPVAEALASANERTAVICLIGEFDNPVFVDAMARVVAAARTHGKALGRVVPNTDQGVAWFRKGFTFCCYSGDVWVLRDALSAAVTTLRKGCV